MVSPLPTPNSNLVQTLEHQHVRIIMRHMIIPHIKNCSGAAPAGGL